LLALAIALSIATPAAAQQAGAQSDSTRLYRLDALVVTAERAATRLEASTSAVSLLDARQLARWPVRTLADALRHAPGLAFVDFDGLGADPQLVVRGFYGGGEAEYVVVLVDGQPLNTLETGRVPWDMIPLAAIESIEVVRGGGSAAWGDAAMGGVINVITRRRSMRGGSASIAGGQHGEATGSITVSEVWAGRALNLSAGFSSLEGFRSHAARRSGSLRTSLGLLGSPDRGLTLSTLHDWRKYDEPGPVTGTALSTSRSTSLPFYRFDGAEEQLHRLGIDGRASLDRGTRLMGSLTGEYRYSERVRTVPLAPTFADTEERHLGSGRLLGSLQMELEDIPLPGDDQLLFGFDGSLGRMKSEYFDVLTGTADVYASSNATRGELDASGVGWRTALGGFVGYEVQASPALRLTAGGRLDWLRDRFHADEPAAAPGRDTDHVAFSPRAGLNLRYMDDAQHRGHVYFNVTGSFKAPTPDQLFDQRTLPVPFPPFEISFANDALKPQHGTSVEAGIYHRGAIVLDALVAELTISMYHMNLRDELDFDLETFRYQNIGRSRHRGIEAGLDLRAARPFGAFVRYTLQSATSRTGEHFGNYLKAIPRHFIFAGVDAGGEDGLAGSVVATSAFGIYLDDANTVELPNWTRFDAKLSYRVGDNSAFVQVANLFDAEYSTTGFPDSADPSVIHYYPAAGRTLRIGLSRGW
jgi:outer membrane receptor protein involved in Fe transport